MEFYGHLKGAAFNDSSIMGHFIEEIVLCQFMKTVNQFELCICAELREVAFYVKPSWN